jgi:hypothetical protein
MKLSIVAGFALTVLATTSAFASPQTAASAGQPVVLETTYVHAVAAANGTDDINADNQNGAQPFASKSSPTVIVADNRKEFGSSYQRY